MKKIYLAFLLLVSLMSKQSLATTVTVTVTNFQFTPSNFNIVVGDVVHFVFTTAGGFHNATTNNVPNGLPAGAAALYSGAAAQSDRTYDYTATVVGTYKYICEIHGDAASFSGMAAQFTVTVVTPVTLTQFNIEPVSAKPLLTWSTSSETNASYFSIRSSTDNKTFTEVGRVNATGNSSSKQFYSYTDNSITTNSNFIYYELAIVDKNGNEQLSPIKLFKNVSAATRLIEKLNPNPITRPGMLMVYFNSTKNDMLNVQVFDATGKQVLTSNMEAVQGLNSGHIHVCNFSAGIYTLIFSMNGLKETKQVVVN